MRGRGGSRVVEMGLWFDITLTLTMISEKVSCSMSEWESEDRHYFF
jgi:hypothetical protein